MLDVNVAGYARMVQAAHPALAASGRGRVINLASITFYLGFPDGLGAYIASKGAVIGLTRALARELGPLGVTVNAIAPGAFPTRAEEIIEDRAAYDVQILSSQAIKRRGDVGDIAAAVLFLASDARIVHHRPDARRRRRLGLRLGRGEPTMAESGAALGRRDILERVGDLRQWGGTRLVTLEDGAERGVRVVEVSTAAGLDFGVIVDRALDIGWFRWRGRSCAWLSPTGFTGPWYREPEGLGFLRSFARRAPRDVRARPRPVPAGRPSRHVRLSGPNARRATGSMAACRRLPAILRHHGTRWDGDTARLVVEGDVRQAGALAENLAAAPPHLDDARWARRRSSRTRSPTRATTRPRTCTCTT